MSMSEFHCVINGFDAQKSTLERYVTHEKLSKLTALIERRRNDAAPVIMVYGVYNAGKSTLINALVGAELANVSDRPETDRVTPYPWGNFKLLDTPGIDAPKEHEEVTEAQLDAADVVIFVLSSHGVSEERSTFEAIVNLVKRKRRVMVVINNKTGLMDASVDMLALKDKIRENLQVQAKRTGVDNILELVPIELVHAKSALKGRLEGKATLLQHSGLEKFEHKLLAFLSDTKARDVVRSLASEVTLLVDEALMVAGQKAQNLGSQKIDKVQARLERERQFLETELRAKVHSTAREMKGDIRSLLENARDQASIETGHQKISQKYSDGIRLAVEDSLRIFSSKLPSISDELELGEVHAGSIHTDAEITAINERGGASNRIDLSAIQSVLARSLQQIAKKDVVSALKFGKDILPQLFKGVGPVGMNKLASGTMKALGKKVGGKFGFPIVDGLIAVGSSIHAYYQAEKETKRQLEEERRMAQAIEDGVSQFSNSFIEHAETAVVACIDQAFAPMFEQIGEVRKQLTGDSRVVSTDAEELRAFKRVLDTEMSV